MTGWPGWRVDLAWEMLPRLVAFRAIHDGTAGRLKPDALYELALAAGLPDSEAAELRDAREDALAGDAAASAGDS